MAFSGCTKRLCIKLSLSSSSSSRKTVAFSNNTITTLFLSQFGGGFLRTYNAAAASDQMNLIKQLRQRTSAPIKDVEAALVLSNWDIEEAQEELRKKGKVLASKKSSQTAAEGFLALAQNHTKTALIELNCETDFVARNEIFQHLALSLAKEALLVENSSQQVSGAFHVGPESFEVRKFPSILANVNSVTFVNDFSLGFSVY